MIWLSPLLGLPLLGFGATFMLALALCLYLTPRIRRGALRFGVIDRPDGNLKRQKEPVPYLGGVAVYLSFLVTLGLTFEFEPTLLGLLLGGTMVAMLGLFDDLRVLTPGLKLMGQLLAAAALFKSGIAIQLEVLPWAVALPLSVVWIVGVTNAINIIDVSDGLASGVAAVAALALFIVAYVAGDVMIATAALALVGSLVGFLRHNQPPASIYLGDTGSLFVGFMLAALSMIGTYTRRHDLGAVAPLFILAVPILDTTLVSLARLRRGTSPLRGSRDHFAVRLKDHGWSARSVALFAYALSLLGGAGGVVMTLVDVETAAILAAGMSLILGGVFVFLWRLPVTSAELAPAAAHRAPEAPTG